MNSLEKRIYEIDTKLNEMRLRYKEASPAMRKFLTQGAKLLKDERIKLENKLKTKQDQLTL